MLRWIWRNHLAAPVMRSIRARLGPELDQRIDALNAELAALRAEVAALGGGKPWKHNLHIPSFAVHPKLEGPFMAYSTCRTADFLHPDFEALSRRLGLEPLLHRKYWEWVFILHHALRSGAVGPGKRVLGFAVGKEPLPSAFAAAGAQVTATDAPDEIGVGKGWKLSDEFASSLLDLHSPAVLSRDVFLERVTFRPLDMTAIPDDVTGFDFCWSSCSFEHLGDIQAGLDFVVRSVERTLKPGGVAVHTTELNLSSDTDTVAEGPTVLFRKSDIAGLVERLRGRGHRVEEFRVAPDTHVLDFFADTPPYQAPVHLKLKLMGYVTTSVGLVITRGP